MGNRPIRDPDWKEYAIEGPVAEDATSVAFGVMASGDVTADFESIGLAVRGADGSWTPIAVDDGGFEGRLTPVPEDGRGRVPRRTSRSPGRPTAHPKAASSCGCPRCRVPRPVRRPRTSSSTVHRGPAPTSTSISAGGSRPGADGAVRDTGRRGRHALEPACGAPRRAGRRCRPRRSARRRHTTGRRGRRVECVPSLLSVLAESGVDWDARLRPQLALAYDATTRTAHLDAMRLLVADARDGHGAVVDTRST